MEVNIYININFAGHQSDGTGICCIALEYMLKDGNQAVREIYKRINNTTKNRAALLACIIALSHLTKLCFVNIYINNSYVTETINQKWYSKWDFENWTKNGEKIINADLWKQLFEYIDTFKIKFEFEKVNPYTAYMETKLKHIDIGYQEDRKEPL
ncbi:MAG: RNase H family protein [Anaerocolumna sp.]